MKKKLLSIVAAVAAQHGLVDGGWVLYHAGAHGINSGVMLSAMTAR